MIAKNLKYRFYTSCALLSLLILIFKNNLILVFSLIILGVLSLLEFYNLVSKIFKNRFYGQSTNFTTDKDELKFK